MKDIKEMNDKIAATTATLAGQMGLIKGLQGLQDMSQKNVEELRNQVSTTVDNVNKVVTSMQELQKKVEELQAKNSLDLNNPATRVALAEVAKRSGLHQWAAQLQGVSYESETFSMAGLQRFAETPIDWGTAGKVGAYSIAALVLNEIIAPRIGTPNFGLFSVKAPTMPALPAMPTPESLPM